MHKKIKKMVLGAFVAGAFATMSFATCAQAAPSLNKSSATISIGKTVTLSVKGAKKVSGWESDDVTVASVTQKGVVTGYGYGTSIITVKADGKTLKATVNVKDPNPKIKVRMPFSGYKKLSKNAKGRAKDVIDIAMSQAGYQGEKINCLLKTSYFGTKWATYEMNSHDPTTPGAWCTDFASWCLIAAKVPGSAPLYSVKDSYQPKSTFVYHYNNSVYKYKDGYKAHKKEVDKLFKGVKCAGTLNAKTIKIGDLVISNGGHHITIVTKVYSNGSVKVVEGNAFSVVLAGRTITADDIYAVIRPNYNK